MTGPAYEIGRFRVSHADRERVVDALKAAFVQGGLTEAELDTRVGQALAARTHADLAMVLIPAPVATRPPAPHRTPVKAHATAIAGVVAAAAIAIAGQSGAAVVVLTIVIVIVAAVATALVAALIDTALEVRARHPDRGRPDDRGTRADRLAPPGW